MKALKILSKSSLEVMYHLAYSRYKQGLYAEAEGLFRILTRANVEERKFWMGLGLALHSGKKYAEAIDAYELAAALEPKDPHVNLQAAECFFALNQKKEGFFALECAERALSMQKEPEEVHYTRIALLRAAWNPRGAMAHG